MAVLSGWDAVVGQLNHNMRVAWRLNRVAAGFEQRQPLLRDIAAFIAENRRSAKANEDAQAILDAALVRLLTLVIAPYFEAWVLTVYSRTNDLDSDPRVLRNAAHHLTEGKRPRRTGRIDLMTIWRVLEQSRLVPRSASSVCSAIQSHVQARCH